jgi:hypothetical protein
MDGRRRSCRGEGIGAGGNDEEAQEASKTSIQLYKINFIIILPI